MIKKEFYIAGSDAKTKLHGFTWAPEGEVKAVLQLVHGMVEYIERYEPFAEYLTERGIAVIGHDHLGHGKSVTDEEKLGFFAEKDGANILIADMLIVTGKGKTDFPGKPFYILGHSMGSFLVRRYMASYSKEIDGAVIMGTGWIPAGLAGFGRTVAKLISKTKGQMHRSKLLTTLALGSNNKPFEPARTPNDWLSKNEANVDRYNADPLCGYMFTSAAYVDFFTVLRSIAKEEGYDTIRKDLPVLIVAGEKDPVGGPAACENVKAQYEKLGLTDITMKLYQDDRHEILNEDDRETVYGDIYAWLTK